MKEREKGSKMHTHVSNPSYCTGYLSPENTHVPNLGKRAENKKKGDERRKKGKGGWERRGGRGH